MSAPNKAKKSAYSEEDPFHSLATRDPLPEPSRNHPDQAVRHHRGLAAFQVPRGFFCESTCRVKSKRALGWGQRICTLPSDAQGQSIAELPLCGQRRV